MTGFALAGVIGWCAFAGYRLRRPAETWNEGAPPTETKQETPPKGKASARRKHGKSKKAKQPFRSARAGWALKLSGLLYWLVIASPLTDGISEFIGKHHLLQFRGQIWLLLWAPSAALIYWGYRLCQKPFCPGAGSGGRKPFLFLRPFAEDAGLSLQPGGFLAWLAGLRVQRSALDVYGLNSAPAVTGRINIWNTVLACHPARLLRMVFDRDVATSEESLVRFFKQYGRVFAIGKPGEALATPGAQRDYLDDDSWQVAVSQKISEAPAVVIQPGRTPGVRWELEQIRRLASPEHVLLCMVSFWREPQAYEELTQLVRQAMGIELPRVVPFLRTPVFIYFRTWFKLTDQSLETLRNKNLPEGVLSRLTPLKDKELQRINLESELARLLSADEKDKFLNLIVNHAYFRGDWNPKLQPVSYTCPLLWPLTGNAVDLDYCLRPFIRGLDGHGRGRPRRPRWVDGYVTAVASFASLFVALGVIIAPLWGYHTLLEMAFARSRSSLINSSWTTLRGRTVAYSLSVPASLVQFEKPDDVFEHPEHRLKSPDGNLMVVVGVIAAPVNVWNIGAERRQALRNDPTCGEVWLESTITVEVAGVEWTEARLLLRRKDNGALVREKVRAFSDARGSIMILTEEAIEGDDSYDAITEKILASVRLDSTISDDWIVGRWQSVDAPVQLGRVIQEFSKDGQWKITIAGTTTKGTYKLDGDIIDWRSGTMTAKVKVKFTSSTDMELSNEAGRVRYKKIGTPQPAPKGRGKVAAPAMDAGEPNPQAIAPPATEAENPVGVLPVGADGKPLNLDFETGTLRTGPPRAKPSSASQSRATRFIAASGTLTSKVSTRVSTGSALSSAAATGHRAPSPRCRSG